MKIERDGVRVQRYKGVRLEESGAEETSQKVE
jgi:hypothetical protein